MPASLPTAYTPNPLTLWSSSGGSCRLLLLARAPDVAVEACWRWRRLGPVPMPVGHAPWWWPLVAADAPPPVLLLGVAPAARLMRASSSRACTGVASGGGERGGTAPAAGRTQVVGVVAKHDLWQPRCPRESRGRVLGSDGPGLWGQRPPGWRTQGLQPRRLRLPWKCPGSAQCLGSPPAPHLVLWEELQCLAGESLCFRRVSRLQRCLCHLQALFRLLFVGLVHRRCSPRLDGFQNRLWRLKGAISDGTSLGGNALER